MTSHAIQPEHFRSYRHILRLAVPLVLAHAVMVLLHLVDALMLSWYSQDALAAVGPASLSIFTATALFVGIAGYTSTFVAQYIGARRSEEVGAVVWQGIYFGLAAGLVLVALSPLSPWVFRHLGHPPAIERLEAQYFQILCYGAPVVLITHALVGFFAGRGNNRPLLAVHVSIVAVNGVLDYLWIFGYGGFPRWGVAGAAWATVVSQVVGMLILGALYLRPKYRAAFGTWRDRAWNWAILRQLMYWGAPAGLRMVTEVGGWTLFLFFIGRIGGLELAASSLVFRINALAFVPLFGLSVAISALVGQAQGQQRPELAEAATWRGLLISEAWMIGAALVFVLAPRPLVDLFRESGKSPAEFEPLMDVSVVLLRFVAVYCLLDACNVTVMAALQGAGDTRWTMWMTGLAYLGMLAVMIVLDYLGAGAYVFWTTATVFVMVLGLIWLGRFHGGRWKTMRVVEPKVEEEKSEIRNSKSEEEKKGRIEARSTKYE